MDATELMPDVNNIWERLRTNELEYEELVIDPTLVEEVANRGKSCLLLKVLTTRYYNREAFKNTMRKVWRPAKPLRFHEMGEGLLMADFELSSDKLRVLRDGPWSFDKSLILVREFDGFQQVKDIKMVEALFWVRVYDLPLLARNEYIGNLIGNALGRVEEIDMVPGEMEWGEYMRIRVAVDVTRPLLRKKRLNIGLPEPVWVNFKYERLPDFCFCCGLIGHSHKECSVWKAAPEWFEQNGLPYNISLRAGFNGGGGGAAKQRPVMQTIRSTTTATPTASDKQVQPLSSPTHAASQLSRPTPPHQEIPAPAFGTSTAPVRNLHENGKSSLHEKENSSRVTEENNGRDSAFSTMGPEAGQAQLYKIATTLCAEAHINPPPSKLHATLDKQNISNPLGPHASSDQMGMPRDFLEEKGLCLHSQQPTLKPAPEIRPSTMESNNLGHDDVKQSPTSKTTRS